MSDRRRTNPWVMAAVSWAIASALVGGGFAAYALLQRRPVPWDLVRDAALMVAPIALFLGWRDSRRAR